MTHIKSADLSQDLGLVHVKTNRYSDWNTTYENRSILWLENKQISKYPGKLFHNIISKYGFLTGPLTQATGPPRSGAGVAVGMLRGAGDSPT